MTTALSAISFCNSATLTRAVVSGVGGVYGGGPAGRSLAGGGVGVPASSGAASASAARVEARFRSLIPGIVAAGPAGPGRR